MCTTTTETSETAALERIEIRSSRPLNPLQLRSIPPSALAEFDVECIPATVHACKAPKRMANPLFAAGGDSTPCENPPASRRREHLREGL